VKIKESIWFAFLYLHGATSFAAGTGKEQEFEGLKKITVGPYDNFQSSIDDDETVMYFTRSQNLSSQIMRVDLKTNLIREATGVEADSKNPAVSPDGQQLLVTAFKRDAKGDICLVTSGETKCVTGPGQGEFAPFWLSNSRFGYLQSNDAGTQSKIFLYDLSTGKSEVVLEGPIYSPSISHNGKSIVYKGQGSELLIFDLTTRKVTSHINSQLPGVTGPAKFSFDDQYIYFSQYMQDTYKDQILDSRDTSAIFRVKVAGQENHPEQMTSLDKNCSYPVPAKYSLYMTCAFEGALDVYKTKLSGAIPASWNKDDLWEAHQSARSYSDRILIVNHLYSRFHALESGDFANRNLTNFMLMNAWMPAAFYAELLKDKDPVYGSHLNILETNYKWESLPGSENIAELARLLAAQTKKLSGVADSPLKQVAFAYIDYFGNRTPDALHRIEALPLTDPATIYWQTLLLEKLYTDTDSKTAGKKGDKTTPSTTAAAGRGKYLHVLEAQIMNLQLSEETRFYYLSRWFETLPLDQDPTEQAQALVARLNKSDKTSGQIGELLENEAQLYRLVKAQTKVAGREEIKAIVSRVERLNKEYHAKRLLFSRCMMTLARNGKSRELATVMSLWMSYLKPDSKEFPYAVEALRKNSLDVAYRFYNGPQDTRPFAAGSFLDSIRTTDDLESHYQYTLFSNTDALWKELSTAYTSMLQQKLIKPESYAFMETIKKVLMSGKTTSSGDLADAIKATESIADDHVGAGVKYLFLGYLYHNQLIRSQKNFEFDRDLAEKTHRSYLFAIDGAWNNERIQAAAYQNLGLLHMQLRNESLAADFLQKRHTMGFTSNDSRIENYWIEAEALFRSYRAAEALNVIGQAIELKPKNMDAFQERQAFYAWNAGDYKKAVAIYGELLPKLGAKARSSVLLSQGFALSKVGDSSGAEKVWNLAIEKSLTEKAHPQGRLVYQPQKIRFTALGLLANLKINPPQKIRYLTQRLQAYGAMISSAQDFYFDAKVLKSQEIKEVFHLLSLHLDARELAAAGTVAKDLLEKTNSFGDAYGYLNQTVFSSLKNTMLALRSGSLESSPGLLAALSEIWKSSEKEFAGEKIPTTALQQQWGEVKLVHLFFIAGKSDGGKQKFEAEGKKLLESDFGALAKDQPEAFQALSSYMGGIVANW
jgi:hypothetical protein